MERREFLTAVGAVAAFAVSSEAYAQSSGAPTPSMHPPKYKALQDDCGHCVATANDCLRHCLGMLAMNDNSMNGCLNTAYQVIAACGALQALAAVNSPQVPAFAKATAEICVACQKQCEKFPDMVECKACAESCRACAEQCLKTAA